MNARILDAIEIRTVHKTPLEIDCFNIRNAWSSLSATSSSLEELLSICLNSRFTLVDARYDCDPMCPGAFRTRFLSNSFKVHEEHPSAAWVRPALSDYAGFPWEAVWCALEPLFRNDFAGPHILRIFLVHPRIRNDILSMH